MTLPPPPPPGEPWITITGNIGLVYNRGSREFSNPELNAENFSPIFVSNKLVDKGTLSAHTSESTNIAPMLLIDSLMDEEESKELKKPPVKSSHKPVDIMTGSEFAEHHLMGESTEFAPLWTLNDNLIGGLSSNFTDGFVKHLRSIYKDKPLFTYSTMCYVYGSLNDPNYLNKYRAFVSQMMWLKTIFVEDYELFRQIAWHGHHLLMCHMEHPEFRDTNEVNFTGDDRVCDSCNYVDGKLYINKTSYFTDIEPGVYNYTIGGYRPLRKYIQSYKGEELDIDHYSKIIKILRRSIDLKRGLARLGAEY